MNKPRKRRWKDHLPMHTNMSPPEQNSETNSLVFFVITSSHLLTLNHSFPLLPDRKSLTPIEMSFPLLHQILVLLPPHAFCWGCGFWSFGGDALFLGLFSCCGLIKVGVLDLGFNCSCEKPFLLQSCGVFYIWVLNCLGVCRFQFVGLGFFIFVPAVDFPCIGRWGPCCWVRLRSRHVLS